jgi:hypothetical protein
MTRPPTRGTPSTSPARIEDWDKQSDESAPRFHAFAHYRDLPSDVRSINEAYNHHRLTCQGLQERAKRASGRWKDWAQEQRWALRADAYDIHLDRIKVATAEDQAAQAQAMASETGLMALRSATVSMRRIVEQMEREVVLLPAAAVFASIGLELDELQREALEKLLVDRLAWLTQGQMKPLYTAKLAQVGSVLAGVSEHEGPRIEDFLKAVEAEEARRNAGGT